MYALSAENGISNEMANYLTMVFDPMAPSIRAAKTEQNSSYAGRLANLSAELDRLLSSKNMTFLELMNAVAVRSGHSNGRSVIVVMIILNLCCRLGAMTPCHCATSITSSTRPAAGWIYLILFPSTRWPGHASG